MSCEDFLVALAKFGEANYKFIEKPISQIPKSCCNTATTVVYDFDYVSTFYASKFEKDELSSCDCLKVLKANNRIDFIELKDNREFFKSVVAEKKKVTPSLADKIHDSLHILYSVITDKAFKEYKKDGRDILKNEIDIFFIIATNSDLKSNPFGNIVANLTYLSISFDLQQIQRDFIDNISISSPFKIQKPILKTCEEIDSYYQGFE